MGGNLFLVEPMGPSDDQADNLHAIWDSVVGSMIGEDPQQPLDETDWVKLGDAAESIMTTYPKSSFNSWLLNRPVTEWTNETYLISKYFVYTDITENGEVSQDYIDTRLPIANQQLAKGGYRLADYLRGMATEMALTKPDYIE